MQKNQDNKELGAELSDPAHVARDYALMRLEHLVASNDGELLSCSENDFNFLSDEYHSAMRQVLVSMPMSLHREEFRTTQIFDANMRAVKARWVKLQPVQVKPVQEAPSTHSARLPKINMKEFDGKLENWVSFRQLYESLIHKRADLTDVEKLHYLLTIVKNEAYNLIKSYPLTNESYSIAYSALCRRYNKTRQIATVYYEKLVNCEPVRSSRDLDRVIRTFTENLMILKSYKLPDRNFMLVHLLWSKLDKVTKEQFELEHNSDEVPDFDVLGQFIEKRRRALENVGGSTVSSIASPVNIPTPSLKNKAGPKQKTAFVAAAVSCVVCKGSHDILACPTFLEYSPSDRFTFVKQNRLCILCLSSAHSLKLCRSKQRCEQCHYSHHTLLHFHKPEQPKIVDKPPEKTEGAVAMVAGLEAGPTLFSTAIVLVADRTGKRVPVRVLLDCASACNFISQQCVNKLGLKISRSRHTVSGIGQAVAEPSGTLPCTISPNTGEHDSKFSVKAYVLPTICSDIPTEHIEPSSWLMNKDLVFADPCWYKPGPVDMLLSVDVFAASLRPGLIQGDPGQPTIINTVFGWIVMGGCALDISRPRRGSCHITTRITQDLSLDESIKKFWELEEVNASTNAFVSKDDALCEQHFVTSYRRTEEGRYIVPLPFADFSDKPTFNGSRAIALKRFSLLEKKLRLNPELSKNYIAFMEDYETCHHLEKCDPPASDSGNFYYIPHHGVLRLSSTSTPLRVVFDASAKDARGTSLNDTLLAGPKLQKNIFHLLLRFRWHAVVFTADVKQMYRQILVFPEDAEYQRILWRPSPSEPIGDYRLLTVTYGVSSAPFQALRTIEQLAEDSASSHPDGSGVLRRDTYVDDIVTGADSVEQATKIRSDLSQILASGGFHLRKWTSNCPDFFVGVPPEDLYCERFREFESIDDMSLKILGLLWLPQIDCFTFKITVEDRRCTKRTILSEIARIFDPLGLLSPLTFFAKYLMQLLWISGVAWDDDAPENISWEWQAFRTQLPALSSVTVPRRMVGDFVVLQLHGFCDASERGMCAVIYCRMLDTNGVCTVQLSCAKSKVAPLRRLSIPRLELSAAVLLADLMASVQEALKPFRVVADIFAWSDSTVALSWIKSCPSRWKTFVANRVSHIQDTIPPGCWQHVRTADNPADCGSRGLLPQDLVNQTSWWNGPSWLSQPVETWPRSTFSVDANDDVLLGEQKLLTLVACSGGNLFETLLNKFSSLKTLEHVLAYCLRYVHNLKNCSSKNNVITGPLTPTEVSQALMALVKFVQRNNFSSGIELLENNKFNSLPKPFKKLSPFVDDAGLLRVGGRLSRSSLDFDIKHPLLLPRDDRLTVLLIEEYHKRFMHPGVQTLQNLLAQKFWILSPKRAIRAVLSKCLKCFRVRPLSAPAPLMGDLPAYRINKLKPFSSAAVDYGGPFDVSLGRGRGNKTYKAYICVFVCTSTKAVHVELATELSAEAFLAALRRFVARRGHCCRLVSDQGKNFVGASNILKRLIGDAAHASEIRFEFNPPGSPHFSGLAESGIKAFKTHLSRVVGQQRLTYEEFYTVLTQVEALLNSRPLTPLSADPNDLSVLTPGHFLTTEPLSIVPDESLTDVNVSILHRWKLLQKMHQDFWAKWSQEYMHTLQQRMKWHDRQVNINKGALVLLLNEQTSPMKWPLGRIVDTHPGADGICRVVTVRTACGLYKRPVVKLCPLPT